MPKKSSQPATKGDLAIVNKKISAVAKDIDNLARATKNTFDHIEKNMATKDDLKDFATKDDLKDFATKDDLKDFATKYDLEDFKTDIVHEFKMVATDIHQNASKANEDEISLIKDQKIPELERRVTTLEQRH